MDQEKTRRRAATAQSIERWMWDGNPYPRCRACSRAKQAEVSNALPAGLITLPGSVYEPELAEDCTWCWKIKQDNSQMNKDGYFDDRVAETYDQNHGGDDTELVQKTVDLLLELGGRGNILEFAVGTGRIAIPLAERAANVKGIEISEAMVRKLRSKPQGDRVDVVIGDMTTTRVPGEFSLVFLVFNTIDNLTTQQAQIDCFKNAALHLAPGGRFLIETLVPPIQKVPFGETRLAFANSADHVGIDEFDIATQQYSSNHVWMTEHGHEYQSIPFRYAWPSELDLMARLAGLELESRWSDWNRASFDRLSTQHISVWRKP